VARIGTETQKSIKESILQLGSKLNDKINVKIDNLGEEIATDMNNLEKKFNDF
jgi:hypothetical protein